MPYTVLIYHANAARTAEYADLLRPVLPDHRLLTASTPEAAAAQIAEVDILFSWRFPAELYPVAERLRWVQAMGAGIEDLIAAPVPDPVQVTRVEGLFGGYMSEYAFGHMLAHAQQLRRIYAAQDEQRWEPFFIARLSGKRLGVAGAGSIGSEVARLGKALGMEVWTLSRSGRETGLEDRAFTMDEVAEFTAGVDYLVSSLPLTPETINLIDPARMKPGALLVNMGRGATVNEAALLEAARSGRVSAVLDVFTVEPLPQDHPFWTTPGITVTPHISGPSVPSDVAGYFVANLRRLAEGRPLVGLVDRKRGY